MRGATSKNGYAAHLWHLLLQRRVDLGGHATLMGTNVHITCMYMYVFGYAYM